MLIQTHTLTGARDTNQDALFAGEGWYGVLDGLGSYPRSDKCSADLAQDLMRSEPTGDYLYGPRQHLAFIEKKVLEHHAHWLDYNRLSLGRGSTTCTCISIQSNRLALYHVGDSRLYISKPQDVLRQITNDHRSGRHCLTSAIGTSGLSAQKQILDCNWKTLVLSTDGIHDTLSVTAIDCIVRNAREDQQDAAAKLCKRAVAAGSQDNCTAIVIYR